MGAVYGLRRVMKLCRLFFFFFLKSCSLIKFLSSSSLVNFRILKTFKRILKEYVPLQVFTKLLFLTIPERPWVALIHI